MTPTRPNLDGWLHTLALLAAIALSVTLAGWLLGGGVGVLVALLLTAAAAAGAQQLSPHRALRRAGATPLDLRRARGLVTLVGELSKRAGLPTVPTLYYAPSPVPNAAAMGRPDEGVVLVTDGLLRLLDRRELAGVLAHEVSHLAQDDLGTQSLAAAASHTVETLSRLAVWMVLIGLLFGLGATTSLLALAVLWALPSGVELLRLALSRTRELEADAHAAQLTGDPLALARALQRLESASRHPLAWLVPRLRAPQMPTWLASHPPTAERVRRLAQMGA